jgi:hypothetical protein
MGAEAATTAPFTRLLWPQRAYSNLRFRHLALLGLLLPSGGPLYKAVLEVLDKASKYGLFRGTNRGHMLRTAFFQDGGSTCSIHSKDSQDTIPAEAARNNIWMKVMELMAFAPYVQTANDTEKAPIAPGVPLRARVAVRHLIPSVQRIGKRSTGSCIEVGDESGGSAIRALPGIFATEVTGIAIAVLVAVTWKSWFAILWVAPLLLKLISLAAALRREPLDMSLPEILTGEHQDFTVHLPAESGTFLVITGPLALVLQFFRHYGHPQRDRLQEVIQLGVIVAFGFLFPVGMLCSAAWMPMPIQYIWLSYQIFVVGMMYISRFMNTETWASTEERIAEMLASGEDRGGVLLRADKKCRLAVEATLETSFFNHYGEGRA